MEFNNFLRSDEGGSTGSVVQIGDNNYIFDVYLWNGETKVGLTFASIEELKIVDDFRYFYSYGYMKFSNASDVLESYNAGGKMKPYNFRGDGRDYLNIEIMPQIKPDDVSVQNVSEEERKEFCLKYTFSIYKTEEELREDKGIKFKKIYFWDVDYQLLNEIDARFTTSEVSLADKTAKNPTAAVTETTKPDKALKNTDDVKRYTGDCLKFLLDKSLNKISKSGFKASKEWDKGGIKIEHHTNSGHKAIDDVQYLINYHVSTKEYDYVPCILKKTRYTDEYTFIPITTYLQNSMYKSGGMLGGLVGSKTGGKNMTEDFTLSKVDTAGSDGMGGLFNFGTNKSSNAFNAINYNVIENYSFVKPDADIVQKDVSTHFVHSYDPQGFFTCSIKSNNLKNSQKSIHSNNIKNMPNTSNSNGADILPTNQLREDNNNVQHVYTSGLGTGQNFQKMNFGRNKGLMASVFKNAAIYFRIKGLTRRRTGTFFNVNRTDNQSPNEHDKMVLGSYFTTMVIHEFNRGSYFNHIYGTKSSSSEKQNFAKML
jgi:hypothetical protein